MADAKLIGVPPPKLSSVLTCCELARAYPSLNSFVKTLMNWLLAPSVYVCALPLVVVRAKYGLDSVELGVSPKRKKSASFGPKVWSMRILVESMELGREKGAMN